VVERHDVDRRNASLADRRYAKAEAMERTYLDWEKATDRESFFTFIRALIADRVDAAEKDAKHPSDPWGPYANDWANASIEAFLEAALRWAESTQMGQSQGLSDGMPSWRNFALFLSVGKMYE
jgi:hypothetical protein